MNHLTRSGSLGLLLITLVATVCISVPAIATILLPMFPLTGDDEPDTIELRRYERWNGPVPASAVDLAQSIHARRAAGRLTPTTAEVLEARIELANLLARTGLPEAAATHQQAIVSALVDTEILDDRQRLSLALRAAEGCLIQGELGLARQLDDLGAAVVDRSALSDTLEMNWFASHAEYLDRSGNPDHATTAHDRAIDLASRLEPEGPALAVQLLRRARFHARRLTPQQATEDLQHAQELISRFAIVGLEHRLAMTRLLVAGIGAGPEQIEACQQLADEIATINPLSPDRAALLTLVGKLELKRNALDAGLAAQRAAYELTRTGRPRSPDLMVNLAFMATVHALNRDLAEARELLAEAMDLVTRPDYPYEARTRATIAIPQAVLAIAAGWIGNSYAEAVAALQALEEHLGPDAYATVLLRMGTGSAALAAADGETARPHLHAALESLRRTGRSFSLDTAFCLTTLATSYPLGPSPEARRYAQEAIELFESLGEIDQPMYALALHLRGRQCLIDGDDQRAKRLLLLSRMYHARVMPIRHPNFATMLLSLAEMRSVTGDPGQALTLALDGAELAHELFIEGVVDMGAEEAMQRRHLPYAGVDLALTLARAAPDTVDIARLWTCLASSRGGVTEELALRQALADDETPELRPLTEAVTRLREKIGRATLDHRGNDLHIVLHDSLRALENQLAARSRSYRHHLRVRRFDLAQALAARPPRTTVISFVRAGIGDWIPERRLGGLDAEPHYVALILPAGSTEVELLSIGSMHEVDKAVQRWRQQASTMPSPLDQTGDRARYLVAGQALAEIIWRPLEPYLKQADQVFIVPDGSLSVVNWLTLPTAENEYLVESDLIVHLLAAERNLVDLPRPRPAMPGPGLLACGDIDYGPRTATERTTTRERFAVLRSAGADRFDALPATASEIRAIAEIWRQDRGQPARLLTGMDASEMAIREVMPRHEVIHLATHGFVVGEPKIAGLGRFDGFNLVECNPDISLQDLGHAPRMLSGLAVAGANGYLEVADPLMDGILTDHEIRRLDLRRAHWVVLSGCNTGFGHATEVGEGVQGFRQAFRIAGAQAVIMSLWPVEDQTTLEWMTALYQARFQRHLGTAAAIREAGRQAIAQRRAAGQSDHPFFWGGFTAIGRWD